MNDQTSSPDLRGHYAGFVSRLFAFVIDLSITSATILVVTSTINNILTFFGFDFLLSNSVTQGGTALLYMRVAYILAMGLGSFLFVVAYYILFWMTMGQTIGKLLMGLRVVRKDGRRLTFWGALRRYFGYWISALPFFLGYVWVLVHDRRQGWHDIFAGSVVVYAWNVRMNTHLFPGFNKRVKKLE